MKDPSATMNGYVRLDVRELAAVVRDYWFFRSCFTRIGHVKHHRETAMFRFFRFNTSFRSPRVSTRCLFHFFLANFPTAVLWKFGATFTPPPPRRRYKNVKYFILFCIFLFFNRFWQIKQKWKLNFWFDFDLVWRGVNTLFVEKYG